MILSWIRQHLFMVPILFFLLGTWGWAWPTYNCGCCVTQLPFVSPCACCGNTVPDVIHVTFSHIAGTGGVDGGCAINCAVVDGQTFALNRTVGGGACRWGVGTDSFLPNVGSCSGIHLFFDCSASCSATGTNISGLIVLTCGPSSDTPNNVGDCSCSPLNMIFGVFPHFPVAFDHCCNAGTLGFPAGCGYTATVTI